MCSDKQLIELRHLAESILGLRRDISPTWRREICSRDKDISKQMFDGLLCGHISLNTEVVYALADELLKSRSGSSVPPIYNNRLDQRIELDLDDEDNGRFS